MADETPYPSLRHTRSVTSTVGAAGGAGDVIEDESGPVRYTCVDCGVSFPDFDLATAHCEQHDASGDGDANEAADA
jgi:hypothetical protein